MKVCDTLAVVDFNKDIKKPGSIPYVEHNIRCSKHATEKAYARAGLEGYDSTVLNNSIVSIQDSETS